MKTRSLIWKILPVAGILFLDMATGFCKKEEKPVEKPRAVMVSSAKGTVQIESGGTNRKGRVGDILYTGDTIITLADSTVDIQLEKGVVIHIAPSSKLLIDRLLYQKDNNSIHDVLKLQGGSAYSRVERMPGGSSFDITTPTAIASVRGTEFRVNITPNGTSSVSVSQGSVNVKAGEKEKPVGVNERADVDTSGGVNSAPLSDAEKKNLEEISKSVVEFSDEEWEKYRDHLRDEDVLNEKPANIDFIIPRATPSPAREPTASPAPQPEAPKKQGLGCGQEMT